MKKTGLPNNFEVTARIEMLAKINGWPDPHSEIDAFKDYHLAHGSLMADWEAAFRTWLRNAKEWRTKKQPLTPEPKIIRRYEDRPKDTGPYDPKVKSLIGDLVKKLST